MTDFTNQFNTELSPEELKNFNSWANNQPRNINNEKYDYDIQGWWKNSVDTNNSGNFQGDNLAGADNLNNAHLTDQFKKPNHPTFSTESQYHGKNGLEGGMWAQLPDGSYTFTPGATNLDQFKTNELQDYFNRVEPGNKLILPSKYRLTPVSEAPRF